MKLATVFKDMQFDDIDLGYWINGSSSIDGDFEDIGYFSPESPHTHIWISYRGKYKGNYVNYDVIDLNNNEQSILSNYTLPNTLFVYGATPSGLGGNVYIPYESIDIIRSSKIKAVLNRIKNSKYGYASKEKLPLSEEEKSTLKEFILNEINRSHFTVQTDYVDTEDDIDGTENRYEITFSGLHCYGQGKTNLCLVDGPVLVCCPNIPALDDINRAIHAEVEKSWNTEIVSEEEDYDEGFDDLDESNKRHKRRLYY